MIHYRNFACGKTSGNKFEKSTCEFMLLWDRAPVIIAIYPRVGRLVLELLAFFQLVVVCFGLSTVAVNRRLSVISRGRVRDVESIVGVF